MPQRFFVLLQVIRAVSVFVDIPFLQEAFESQTRESQQLVTNSMTAFTCSRSSPSYHSVRQLSWWLWMFSLVLRRDKHRKIKRSGVAGEFAVHLAGEIDASDQVLSKSVVYPAQAHGLVAKSK